MQFLAGAAALAAVVVVFALLVWVLGWLAAVCAVVGLICGAAVAFLFTVISMAPRF
jgi:hypothetical protein